MDHCAENAISLPCHKSKGHCYDKKWYSAISAPHSYFFISTSVIVIKMLDVMKVNMSLYHTSREKVCLTMSHFLRKGIFATILHFSPNVCLDC